MHRPTSQRLRRCLTRSALTCVVLGTLALSACGSSASTASLDEKKIERAIERSSLAQRGLRARVTCPADVQLEKGMTFECIARVDDASTRFVVTQTDAAGHVRYEAP
jgi:Domain of unknown function (DUF4333)